MDAVMRGRDQHNGLCSHVKHTCSIVRMWNTVDAIGASPFQALRSVKMHNGH